MPRFPRLDLLLGVPVEQWSEAELARAVELAVREDSDLDFKREPYPSGKSDEAAKDVAAMANAGGGVLVLGMEDAGSRASGLRAFDPENGAHEARVRGSVADLVAPVPVGLGLRWVDAGEEATRGYLLVMVPRSADVPHAVRKGSKLGYPTRDGDHVRWLSESEVAARYRARFAWHTERAGALEAVQQTGWGSLVDNRVWLSLTFLPEVVGHAAVGLAGVEQVRRMVERDGAWFPSPLRLRGDTVRVGLRRTLVSGQVSLRGTADESHAELHEDGSGFLPWTCPAKSVPAAG